jgi:hypothetical protein
MREFFFAARAQLLHARTRDDTRVKSRQRHSLREVSLLEHGPSKKVHFKMQTMHFSRVIDSHYNVVSMCAAPFFA